MRNSKEKPTAKFPFPDDKIWEFVLVLISVAINFLYTLVDWWVICANLLFLLAGVLILYYLNNKNKIESINEEIEMLKDISQGIKELSTYPALLEHVCGSKELMMIEGSVGDNGYDDHMIFVQSSKFELESNIEFSHMLINNLRKGVKYNYLIPYSNNKLDYRPFYEMVFDWWSEYSKFVIDKEYCNDLIENKNEFWQKKYTSCLNKAASYWNNKNNIDSKWDKLIDELYLLFKKRLSVYTADPSLFYIVTAIYQVGRNQWKAIIKLPTEYGNNSKDDYYSFVVFGKTYSDADNKFITKFKHNFRDDNHLDMKELYAELDERVGDLKNGKHKFKG